MAELPLQDFAPDVDTLKGAITDMDGLYSTRRGLQTLPGLALLAAAPPDDDPTIMGSVNIELVTGARQVVIGTRTGLWREIVSAEGFGIGAWEDAIDATAKPIHTTTGRWRFSVFGNLTVAVNGVEVLYSDSGGKFSRVPHEPPPSSMCAATDNGFFLVRANSNLFYAALGGPLSQWNNISIETQIEARALNTTSGPITAVHQLGDGVAVYKDRSTYSGQYIGGPFQWKTDVRSRIIGVPCQEAVVNLGEIHLLMGNDDFYSFDGSSLTPLPNRLRKWFFTRLDENHKQNVVSRYDRARRTAFWHFPSVQANPLGSLDEWVALNLETGKWTKGRTLIEGTLNDEFVKRQEVTYATLGEQYATYDVIPDISYESLTVVGTMIGVPAIFLQDHKMWGFNGASIGGYVTVQFGDVKKYVRLMGVRPNFARWPADNYSRLINHTSPISGRKMPDSTSPAPPSIATLAKPAILSRDGSYDFVQSNRVHQLKFEFKAETEIVSIELDMAADGEA